MDRMGVTTLMAPRIIWYTEAGTIVRAMNMRVLPAKSQEAGIAMRRGLGFILSCLSSAIAVPAGTQTGDSYAQACNGVPANIQCEFFNNGDSTDMSDDKLSSLDSLSDEEKKRIEQKFLPSDLFSSDDEVQEQQ